VRIPGAPLSAALAHEPLVLHDPPRGGEDRTACSWT
jgi:hypothetical protein